MDIFILIISTVSNILVLLVFASAILSFFMDPYHPIRRGLDNIVEPMLSPIRRIVPLVGSLDFSPLVLIILIQVAERILLSILISMR
jgi:YggT family protein